MKPPARTTVGHAWLIMLVALVSTACSAQTEKRQASESDYDDPPVQVMGTNKDGQASVTESELRDGLRRVGLRTIVLFAKVEIAATGTEHYCPVKIRTSDSACEEAYYGSVDPSVICRAAQDSNASDSLKKIVWKGRLFQDEDNPDPNPPRPEFTIVFKGDLPCRNANWDGTTPRERHVCKLKNAGDLGVVEGKSGYFKYDVIGTDPACPVLDPFFIARD